jgi:hypothetical protein
MTVILKTQFKAKKKKRHTISSASRLNKKLRSIQNKSTQKQFFKSFTSLTFQIMFNLLSFFIAIFFQAKYDSRHTSKKESLLPVTEKKNSLWNDKYTVPSNTPQIMPARYMNGHADGRDSLNNNRYAGGSTMLSI